MRPIDDVEYIISNLSTYGNCKTGIKNDRNFEILVANTLERENLTLAVVKHADEKYLSIKTNGSNMVGANFLHAKNFMGRLKESFKNSSASTTKKRAIK